MMHEHFRAALEKLDLPLMRKIWAHSMPHLPQPESDDDMLASAHMARTGAESIRFRLRAYSHSWLMDRGLPSQLPDHLRPRAERLYPWVVEGVGIAVRNRTPVALAIRRAMEEAVLDAGVKNSSLTKRAILSARVRARRQLLGITTE